MKSTMSVSLALMMSVSPLAAQTAAPPPSGVAPEGTSSSVGEGVPTEFAVGIAAIGLATVLALALGNGDDGPGGGGIVPSPDDDVVVTPPDDDEDDVVVTPPTTPPVTPPVTPPTTTTTVSTTVSTTSTTN